MAEIAAKSVKEAKYHVRHSSTWLKRLGDGTELSKERMQSGIDTMWLFTPEMFDTDAVDEKMLKAGIGVDLALVKKEWQSQVQATLSEAKLRIPDNAFLQTGGRNGIHSQHMGYLLAEMQILPRSMPGLVW